MSVVLNQEDCEGLKTPTSDPDKRHLLSVEENGGLFTDGIKDYRYLSICACCMSGVFGTFAILASFRVLEAKGRGDFVSAKRHSKVAKKWGIAGIVSWFIAIIFLLVVYVSLMNTMEGVFERLSCAAMIHDPAVMNVLRNLPQ